MNYSIGPGLYPGIVYFCKRCGQRRIIKAENYQPMIWDDEVPSSLASPVDVNWTCPECISYTYFLAETNEKRRREGKINKIF